MRHFLLALFLLTALLFLVGSVPVRKLSRDGRRVGGGRLVRRTAPVRSRPLSQNRQGQNQQQRQVAGGRSRSSPRSTSVSRQVADDHRQPGFRSDHRQAKARVNHPAVGSRVVEERRHPQPVQHETVQNSRSPPHGEIVFRKGSRSAKRLTQRRMEADANAHSEHNDHDHEANVPSRGRFSQHDVAVGGRSHVEENVDDNQQRQTQAEGVPGHEDRLEQYNEAADHVDDVADNNVADHDHGDELDHGHKELHAAGRQEMEEEEDDDDGESDDIEHILNVKSNPTFEEGNGNDIMLPDHMAGLPVERDGHVNQDVEKEGFFGKMSKKIGGMRKKQVHKVLLDLFTLADKDDNSQLDRTELADWIYNRTLEHLIGAQAENEAQFRHLDTNDDGKIRWTEYIHHVSHLREDDVHRHAPRQLSDDIMKEIRSLNKKSAKNRLQSILQNTDGDLTPLQRLLARDYERWRKADENRDRQLTPEEFLAFRHPEYCHSTLRQLAEEVIQEMDQNDDGQLTTHEFIRPVEGFDHGPQTSRQRLKHFREYIDVDGDGIATKEEMEQYLDPHNKQQAVNRANILMEEADDNRDLKLSMQEVQEHYHLFSEDAGSDVAQSMHNEL